MLLLSDPDPDPDPDDPVDIIAGPTIQEPTMAFPPISSLLESNTHTFNEKKIIFFINEITGIKRS